MAPTLVITAPVAFPPEPAPTPPYPIPEAPPVPPCVSAYRAAPLPTVTLGRLIVIAPELVTVSCWLLERPELPPAPPGLLLDKSAFAPSPPLRREYRPNR